MVKISLFTRASGCPPCNNLKPIWDNVVELYKDDKHALFRKHVAEENKKPFLKHKVRGVPCIIVKRKIRNPLHEDEKTHERFKISNPQKFLLNIQQNGVRETIKSIEHYI